MNLCDFNDSFIIPITLMQFLLTFLFLLRPKPLWVGGCFQRERDDNGLCIRLVPKFYNSVFLFVALTTLGIFTEL